MHNKWIRGSLPVALVAHCIDSNEAVVNGMVMQKKERNVGKDAIKFFFVRTPKSQIE